MNKEEIKESLNKVYEYSQDTHNIYTPLELCEEMINSLTDLSGNILVISNLEFLIVLKSKINLDNVHYTTSCEIKKQVAISLGLNINNIYDLEYNSSNPLQNGNKDINLGTEKFMKFDYIVANPPYKKGLHLKILDKCIDMKSVDGEIIFVHPAEWLVQKRQTSRTKLHDILKNKINGANITFIDNPWNNVALWVPLVITHINNSCIYNFNEKRKFINKQYSLKLKSLYDISFFGALTHMHSVYNKIYNKAKEISFKDIEKQNLNLNKYITLHRFTGSNVDLINKTVSTAIFDNKEYKIYDRFLLHRTDSKHFNIFNEPQYARTGNQRLFMTFNTELEAQNCLNFLGKSKIFVAYFSYIKIDQHAADTLLSWIPWLDWTQEWTDDKLIEFFNLTDEEVQNIEEIINIITIN